MKHGKKYNSISQIVADNFTLSNVGVLNLYKLFVEEIIDKYSNEDAYISLLIPASIMSDKTCAKLRTHMLSEYSIKAIRVIGEGAGYVDAQQALCTVFLKKGEHTDTIDVYKDFCRKPNEVSRALITDIMNDATGNSIIALSDSEYKVLRKLREHPNVKQLDFVCNLRGELDLTANKRNITEEQTQYKLLRGRNIGYYTLLESGEDDYVMESFVESTTKRKYIEQKRIICQQIANMHKQRRVTFALAPENYVLGNSCNFIAVDENLFGLDIYALFGLFNTEIINWFFLYFFI